ncbi:glycoside hydrolase family 3 N-terminal domain-containing protein [Paenarthrobacter nicotinovorans]|uniref:beta-glucosidase n=1 Tax=Paenarthrobacter nicotinovorans TaxID=29320 RepID=UPI00374A3C50
MNAKTHPDEASHAPVIVQVDANPLFDVDDVDGRLFMIDREFQGAAVMAFSNAMDPSIPGKVILSGQSIPYVLKALPWQAEVRFLAIPLFGRLTEPDTEHTLQIEDFTDVDGSTMKPEEVRVRTKPRPAPEPRFATHEELARRVAEEGLVLLENRNATLPLKPGQLNIFGGALHAFRTSVVGAGKINPRYTVGLRDAVLASSFFTLNEELAEFSRVRPDDLPSEELVDRAREASDVGIVVLSRASGENMDNSSDKGEFHLSDGEEALIALVTRAFARTVVILNTPYPIDTSFVDRYGVDALVLSGVAGMLAGPALLRVLEGTVSPSGKLPDTWPRTLEDIPAHKNFYDCAGGKPRYTADDDVWIDTVYEEGIYVGYRYFSTFDAEVAYAFGYGLSYTSFDLAVSTGDSSGGLCPYSPAVTVTNTGDVGGREVVQIYISKPHHRVEQPALELAAFEKTKALAPGEHETLTFSISDTAIASWDEDTASYVALEGEYGVFVGTSVDTVSRVASFEIDEPVTIRKSKHLLVAEAAVTTLSQRDPVGTFPTGKHSGIKPDVAGFEPRRTVALPVIPVEPGTSNTGSVSFSDIREDPSLAAAFAATLTVEQCARLTICAQDGWGMEGTGVAGILAQPDGLNIPLFQVSDGNSGINVFTPNIGMPTTVVLASTFDRKLAFEVGKVIGQEALNFDINVVLAPALNLHRHPLNGRHPEYFSEDPLLAGTMAGQFAIGLESTGVGACYKHIAANNAEASRKRNQSVIPERALRDLYLRAFEIALETYQPATVMTSYNAINGLHTAADAELIEEIVRQEFGFQGMVMTDWNAYDTCDVVDMVVGGTNWITPGSRDDTYTRPIVEAVAAGRLSEARLRQSTAILLRTIAKLTR